MSYGKTRSTAKSESEFAPPAIPRRGRPLVRRVSMEDAVRATSVLLAAREGLTESSLGFGAGVDPQEWALDTLANFLAECAGEK